MSSKLFESLKRVEDALARMEALVVTDEDKDELEVYKKFQQQAITEVLERVYHRS